MQGAKAASQLQKQYESEYDDNLALEAAAAKSKEASEKQTARMQGEKIAREMAETALKVAEDKMAALSNQLKSAERELRDGQTAAKKSAGADASRRKTDTALKLEMSQKIAKLEQDGGGLERAMARKNAEKDQMKLEMQNWRSQARDNAKKMGDSASAAQAEKTHRLEIHRKLTAGEGAMDKLSTDWDRQNLEYLECERKCVSQEKQLIQAANDAQLSTRAEANLRAQLKSVSALLAKESGRQKTPAGAAGMGSQPDSRANSVMKGTLPPLATKQVSNEFGDEGFAQSARGDYAAGGDSGRGDQLQPQPPGGPRSARAGGRYGGNSTPRRVLAPNLARSERKASRMRQRFENLKVTPAARVEGAHDSLQLNIEDDLLRRDAVEKSIDLAGGADTGATSSTSDVAATA